MDKMRIFPSLTGLKGLFIWCIILFHTIPDTPFFVSIPGSAFLGSYGGSLGNAMFFILSGFLLSWGYRDRIREHCVSFADFLGKRLKKLYPPYFISTIVMLLLDVLEYGLSAVNLQRITFDLLMQSGGGLVDTEPYNGPGWFVSALLVCYLAYYLITYHAKHPTAYRCATVLGIVWGYTLLCANLRVPMCYSQNGIAFLNFFIGCALAEVYPYITPKIEKILHWGAILILPVCAWLLQHYGVEVIAGNSNIAFSFVICPLILYLAIENRLCIEILSSKPVLWLGNRSMFLYFWHFVVYIGYRWLLGLTERQIGNLEYGIYVVVLLLFSGLPTAQGVIKNKNHFADRK